jgi:tryptophanyl-tRNA synthetase
MPDVIIDEEVMVVPGTDGLKMSKSYGNTVDIFLPDKQMRKQVMSIITDSTPLEEPKDPDTCNVFALYKLLASEEDVQQMRKNYEGGNYGYGHAKQALFELLVEKFSRQRELFNKYMEDPTLINSKLEEGEEKAREIARSKMQEVREKLGF